MNLLYLDYFDPFPIFFIIFFCVLIFIIVSNIRHYMKNENSPVIATKARLIDKKIDIRMNTDANGVATSNRWFYLIFELDTSSTIRFTVNPRIYHNAYENEWGTLTFQGTRFIKFESSSGILEK